MSFALKIAITAQLDILRTAQWSRDQRPPTAANRWLAGLQKSIQSLADRPMRYPLAEEHENFSVESRRLLHGKGTNKYRTIFSVEDSTVVIFSVRHAARDELNP